MSGLSHVFRKMGKSLGTEDRRQPLRSGDVSEIRYDCFFCVTATAGSPPSTAFLNEKLLALPGVALVMVFFSTMLMVVVERGAAGATIRTGGDALWRALTTVTTVGYGDTYPVTAEGRIIAAVLMLIGIALFGSRSAIVTSKLILPKETRDHEDLRK